MYSEREKETHIHSKREKGREKEKWDIRKQKINGSTRERETDRKNALPRNSQQDETKWCDREKKLKKYLWNHN